MPAKKTRLPAITIGATVAALGVLAYILLRPPAQPTVSGYFQITHDGFRKHGIIAAIAATNAPLVTDGTRVYFTEGTGSLIHSCSSIIGRRRHRYHSKADRHLADPGHLPGPLHAACGRLLNPSWRFRVAMVCAGSAGTPRPLAGLTASDATWSPDGGEIAYVDVGDLYRARSDGTNIRRLVHFRTRMAAAIVS